MVTIHENKSFVNKNLVFLKENWMGILAVLIMLFLVLFTFGRW